MGLRRASLDIDAGPDARPGAGLGAGLGAGPDAAGDTGTQTGEFAHGGRPPFADSFLALRDGDEDARRRAALELGDGPDARDALLAALAVEHSPIVRRVVLMALTGHDEPVTAAALAQYLRSEDAALRTNVVETLAAMPRAVESVVDGLLVDPDVDVRVLTVMVLAARPSPTTVPRLVRLVESDPAANVVAAALDVLIDIGDERHLPAIRRAADRFADVEFVQFTAAEAIEMLTDRAEP